MFNNVLVYISNVEETDFSRNCNRGSWLDGGLRAKREHYSKRFKSSEKRFHWSGSEPLRGSVLFSG